MPTKLSQQSEDLAIRFVNTVAWRLKDPSEERLGSPEALLRWLEQNELISAGESRRLASAWKARPDAASAAHDSALRLREAIYAMFLSVIRQRPADAAVMAYLSEFIGRPSTLRLGWHEGRPSWRATQLPDATDDLLKPIALSAAALVTGPRADRLKQCADERGCGWLFVDDSRLKNRRWCSMGDCGNVAKARRHRARAAGGT
ncbi:CGNR zinc finger domain-containing protein [Bradyrhizobium sp. STM 3557]|uniref:CGNR zinc finger domain-containing protein n=1 Tax=Bradyrhizobium sp. STM 3557 TaxID=578920 RepID=UPI00388FFBD7